MSMKRRISAYFLYILKYKKYAIMGKEGEIMAYSRVEKYQELRDGIKEEAGISKEKKTTPVEVEKYEDDDFLSFMKNDEHIEKEVSLEDTLTEAKTFEQMRREGSKELEEALKSAKRSVGKETEYNTRMDILSKIREPEKTTIKIDSVDEYKTEEFSRGMFLNEEHEEEPVAKEKKKMTFMERLASMSPEEDAKKAEEFLKNEELKKEEEIIEEEKNDEIIEEDKYPFEEDAQIDSQEKIFKPVQEESKQHSDIEDEDIEIQKDVEKQGDKLVKVLDVIILILVVVFIVLLGVIIYQNFF